MSINNIKFHFTEANKILKEFMAKEENYNKIYTAGNYLLAALLSDHKIIACGNGGSMCDAMHFAQDFTGRFRESRNPLPAICISDPAYLSCVATDFGWNKSFSRFVKGFGNEGDILLAISTSGNSVNVVKAAETAKKKKMIVIGLTGKDGGQLAQFCDIEIRAPHTEYADRVQEIHIKVIHALIDFVELNL